MLYSMKPNYSAQQQQNTLKGRDKNPASEFFQNTNLFEMLIFRTNSTIDLSDQGGFDRDSCGVGQHPCQTLSASISYGLISLVTGQLDVSSISLSQIQFQNASRAFETKFSQYQTQLSSYYPLSFKQVNINNITIQFGSIFRIELADYIQQNSQGREELKGKVNKELKIEGLYLNNVTGSSVRSEQIQNPLCIQIIGVGIPHQSQSSSSFQSLSSQYPNDDENEFPYPVQFDIKNITAKFFLFLVFLGSTVSLTQGSAVMFNNFTITNHSEGGLNVEYGSWIQIKSGYFNGNNQGYPGYQFVRRNIYCSQYGIERGTGGAIKYRHNTIDITNLRT
ncbi:MAG: hypothetical protein EZS28_032465, partial [Streblomastix strix]